MKNTNLALGLLGGLAAGAILGLLYAPAKGCDTRKNLADKGLDLNGNLKDTVSNLSGKLSETIAELKKDAQSFLGGSTNEVQQQENKIMDNLKDINKSTVLGQ